MRERLIELLKMAKLSARNKMMYSDIDDVIDTSYEVLQADYLLENGVVVLPCKVGDVVYSIDENCVGEVDVEYIHWLKNRIWEFYGWRRRGSYRTGFFFREADIGKTVFLTKEEAEKALEEMK